MRLVFEKIRDSEGSSFAYNRVCERAFDSPYHIHPEIEILHIRGGRGGLVVGDHVGRYAPGDCMVFGPDLPHMLHADPDLEPGEATVTDLQYVQLSPAVFGQAFWEMKEMRPITGLLRRSDRGLKIGGKNGGEVAACLGRIAASAGALRLTQVIGLLDLLAHAVEVVEMASVGYAPNASHRDSERLDRAIQYINANLVDTLTLDDIAAHAGLSPYAFSRFFHRLVGMTCVGYIVSLRISLACRMLLESDRTIATIAFEVGFNNLSNFNRLFKQVKGCTPSSYRQGVGRPDPSS